MTYKVNFQNTGYIEDGILTIIPSENDGTMIEIKKFDENKKLIARAVLDVVDIFKNGGKAVIWKEV